MLAKLSNLSLKWRRWFYPLISMCVVGIITLGTPLASQAIPWWQILIQGAQIVQLSNVSESQEVQLGGAINQQLSRQVRISNNRALTDYVNQIGQRLARKSARPNLKYTFQVVDDDNINAFATMGGYVYVNRGLLKAADNEAQVAGVIGHEIGHITGRHALQHMKQAAIAQGLSVLAGVDQNQLVQIGVELAVNRPRSRQDEYDADRRGLNNVILAGYAPTAMPEFMKKLMSSNSPPEILSTHPAVPERVARLNQMIPTSYRSRTEGLNNSIYKQRLNSFIGS
jgi:predicted Zn-dependent protease